MNTNITKLFGLFFCFFLMVNIGFTKEYNQIPPLKNTSIKQHTIVFKEGVHYQIVHLPQGKYPKIVEFFSYYCSHCYQFEKIVKALKSNPFFKKNLIKVGIVGLQKKDRVIEFLYARANRLAKAYHVEEKFNQTLFDLIHQKHTAVRTVKDIKNVFTEVGVNKTLPMITLDIDNNDILKDWLKWEDIQYSLRQQTHFVVPSFLIAGKYYITGQGLKNVAQYEELFGFLLTLPPI